ncbi:MAG: glutamate-5-semialdehyde dehydrogenase [Thermoleophilaceae bacterium]|jgi:glutamate-5-semialdehyde dehydrogenase|nr:glutamate-5-semialdehyde dehydrogenase [Thermoleophilaceae bacterium]
MAATAPTVDDVCLAARDAARALAGIDGATRTAALHALAAALEQRAGEILAANDRDMEAGADEGLSAPLLDRLKLDERRLAQIASDVRTIAGLPDPVGETLDGHRLANGLDVRRVRVPLGVVAVVYEARPNVTIDCAALCLKSGNAIVLRGSSMAASSNAALAQVAAWAVAEAGIPAAAISLVTGGDRDELRQLATQDGVVDLIIPRGGEVLKAALRQHATVPVMYAAAGNCHVYVDADADLDDAQAIIVNAKVQRPGVCNAAETLLVHAAAAADFLPRALSALRESGVELRADARARAAAGPLGDSLIEATEEDWATEYQALILAVKVVDSTAEAIEHVNRFGSGHSEAIVTRSNDAARAFTTGVDTACVYVNASTRFTDGGVFGMGAEIGNSTQKLHARGPIGVRELTSYKFVIEGSGQVRE